MAVDLVWVTLGAAALFLMIALAQLAGFASLDVYSSFEHINKGPWSWFSFKQVHERILDAQKQILERHGKPFVVNWWAVNNIILPSKYLAELKQADAWQLNFFTNISEAFRLPRDLYEHDRMISVVKRGLNPQLPTLMPAVKDEVDYAFNVDIKDSIEWRTLTAQELLGSITHRAVSRIIVGPELCRDDVFLQSAQDFIMKLFLTALAIVKLPLGPFRELVAWPLSYFRRRALDKCVEKLQPVVDARIKDHEASGEKTKSSDMIAWTIELSDSVDAARDSYRIAVEIMYNMWAASSAPGGLVTEMVYRLILSPEYLEPLRNEAEKVIGEHGWSEHALNSLVLQDSFVREINRMYPTGTVKCARKVMDKPFVFRDGLTLPAGTRLAFLSETDEIEDPQAFDGFRFARMAAKSTATTDGVVSKFGASTMSQDNLVWGYGTHCCPGRFFAVRVVKIIFTKLLLEYDVEFEGEVKERPAPWVIEGQFIPNLQQKIRVRKRKR